MPSSEGDNTDEPLPASCPSSRPPILMSDNPLDKHVAGHCPDWPANVRLTDSRGDRLSAEKLAVAGIAAMCVLPLVGGCPQVQQ
jgi:hypothetical protein